MKILIVEDSQTMRKIIRVTLSLARFTELEIEEAADGEEALKKIDGGLRPDVVLTDLAMPKMTGTELIKEIMRRKLPIKCGYVTANKEPTKHLEAQAAGAVFFLPKPFTTEQLRRAFRWAQFRE
ncbi:response regulator [candidate division FCPU426 bacterium]|nr:response regulator [candidate division FCPU426 bacterium]